MADALECGKGGAGSTHQLDPGLKAHLVVNQLNSTPLFIKVVVSDDVDLLHPYSAARRCARGARGKAVQVDIRLTLV